MMMGAVVRREFEPPKLPKPIAPMEAIMTTMKKT